MKNFLYQFSVILGLFMSQLAGTSAGEPKLACLKFKGRGGRRGKTACFQVRRLVAAIKTRNTVHIARALSWH